DGFEGVADFGFVVDDQDVVHELGTRFEVRGSRLEDSVVGSESGMGAAGSSMMKVAPAGEFFSARMVPSCSWTILAAMARPRPVPRCLVEKLGRKRRSRISSVRPEPVSETEIGRA